ncbi:MAG: hypothetical protein JST30_06170 [Armatimonadetes bacterium]|nr:hypothetical protein [Armatimonadota bacterium]
MLVSLAIVGATLQPGDFVVARCSAAHRVLQSAGLRLRVDQAGFTSREKTLYSVSYDRKLGVADVTVNRKRPLRVVVQAEQTFAYDGSSKQYTQKPRSDESLGLAVQHGLEVADDVLMAVLEEGGVAGWLKEFQGKGEWSFANEPGMLTAVCKTDHGMILLSIDAKTDLLRHVAIKEAQYGTDWRLDYGQKPTVIAFEPPPGAVKTTELRADTVMPTFGSAEAKAVVLKLFAKYDHPKRLAYEVSSADERSQVWVLAGNVRQNDAKADWSVVSDRFELLDKGRGDVVEGPAALSKIVDAVARSGTRVEPLLKALLRGQNPFRIYFGSNSNVTLTGKATIQGQPCALVESSSRKSKVTLVVRKSDGFVLSMSSRDVGPGAMQGQTRTFRELSFDASSMKTTRPASARTVSLSDYVAQS